MNRTWKFGDEVNTDLMVAGKHMKLPLVQMGQHCLSSLRPEFPSQVKEGDVLVAGIDFGIGSSRDQAPQVLRALGIQHIIAESFGGIFYRNAFNLGVTAIVCPQAKQIPDACTIQIDAEHGVITLPELNLVFQCEPVPAFLLELVENGGLLASLKKRLAARP